MFNRRFVLVMIICMMFIMLSGAYLFAQEDNEWKDTASSIVGEIIIKGFAYNKLLELSDVVGPRVTGTPGFHKAAKWAENEMKSIGLKNVRIEEWPIKEGTWERGRSEAYLIAPFKHKLSIESMGWTPGTPKGGVEAKVVNIGGYKMSAEADPASWSNAILIFDRSREPQPAPGTPRMSWPERRRRQKQLYDKAAEAGAVAILFPFRVRGNRPHIGGGTVTPIPILSIGMEDGQFLQRLTRRGNIEVRMYLNIENTLSKEEGKGCNVIGEIPGREFPEEIVVVGAHLDSWDTGYGVQDDGTGIIAVLETARAFMALGLQPRRTIRFICLGGEEQGFLGSFAYLEKHVDEIAQHVAMFNHDNGAGKPKGFAIGKDRKDVKEKMSKIVESLVNLGATELRLSNPGGTDAVPFNGKGIPIFDMRVSDPDYMEIHHQDTDAFEWFERDHFVIGIAFFASCIYKVADLPERIGSIKAPELKEIRK